MAPDCSSAKLKRRFILYAIPWVLLVGSLAFSISSLTHAVYWLVMVVFFSLLFILVVTGNSGNKNDIENGEYLFLMSRRKSFILGVVGLLALFMVAAVMNSSVPRTIKEDVFLGLMTGIWAGAAPAITLVEFSKSCSPDRGISAEKRP